MEIAIDIAIYYEKDILCNNQRLLGIRAETADQSVARFMRGRMCD